MAKTKQTKPRCWWCADDPIYVEYHDHEWGIPVHEDRKIFEILILEGFQAGLSWITILRKRENFRQAFYNFEPKKVAKMSTEECQQLMQNPGIIRNRLKIAAAVNNAQQFLLVQKEFGTFDRYIWQFTSQKTLRHPVGYTRESLPSITPEALALSKDLKKRGFKFVGPTVCYAHMQATGMVDDHVKTCYKFRKRSGKLKLET